MGKKGGGGGSVPQVKVPQGVNDLAYNNFNPMGYYAASTLPSILGMANWASDIATGGNAMQGGSYLGFGNTPAYNAWNQYTGGSAITPAAQFPGFSSTPGYGGTPGVQSAGAPGAGSAPGTGGGSGFGSLSPDQLQELKTAGYSLIRSPDGQWVGKPGQMIDPNSQLVSEGTNAPSMTVGQFFGNAFGPGGGQALGGGPAATGITGQRLGMMPTAGSSGSSGTSWQQVGQEAGLSQADINSFQAQGLTPDQVAQQFGVPTAAQQQANLLGPFLSNAWNTIGRELSATDMIPGLMNQTQGLTNAATAQSNRFMGQGDQLLSSGQGLLGAGRSIVGQGQNVFNQGEGMLTDATTGAGLYPSQKAFVDQAVQSQKTGLAAQLASEGLGSSTMLQQMKGQADLSGAAEAGKLVQGNISAAQAQEQLGLGQQQVGLEQQQVGLGQESQAQQQYNLGQASQKIALAGQELSLGEQAALTQELASVASQSSGLQSQMWTQAMQGYGVFGSMMQTALSAFGYSLQAFNIQTGAASQNASAAIQAQIAAAQSQQQGMSSMMGGLGQLLGSGGGGGGGSGLLGGLGGLFGGIGSVAGASSAAGVGAVTAIDASGVAAGAGAAAGGGSLLAGVGTALTALGALFCALAREAYGIQDRRWIEFRGWMLFNAPKWLRKLYVRHAWDISRAIRNRPIIKYCFRFVMNFALK